MGNKASNKVSSWVQKTKGRNDSQSKKLDPRFKEPFHVTQVLDKHQYMVEQLPGPKQMRGTYTGI